MQKAEKNPGELRASSEVGSLGICRNCRVSIDTTVTTYTLEKTQWISECSRSGGERSESRVRASCPVPDVFFFVFAFGDHRDSETSSVHGDARMMTGSARRNMNPSRRYSHMPCSPLDHLPTGYSTHHHSFAEFAPRRRPRWDRRSREILLFDDAQASIHTRM